MPTIAQWDVNNECNLNCIHCRVAEKNDKEKLSLNEAKKLIAELWYNGVNMLNLSGGEPFLRKDIFEILDYTRKFQDVVITTNGTLLNEEKCRKLSEYPNIKLSISLDGLEKTHDNFRRKKGTFKRVIGLLPILKKYNIKYAIKYTLSKETVDDVIDVLKLVASKGTKEFNTRRVIVTGNAREKMLLENKEYEKTVRNIIKECRKLNVNFKTGDPLLIPVFSEIFGIDLKNEDLTKIYAGCQAGDENIYIDYKGNIGACSYIPKFADNIKEKPLDDILQNNKLFIDLRDYRNKLKGKCEKCVYKTICGGCRASAITFKNSIFEEDPLCLV